MAFTIVTVPEMQFMAGENVDATGDVTANHQFLHDYAAGFLSAILQDDVIAGFSGYDSTTKFMLYEWAARFAGMSLIAFNMITWSTNTSIIEAEDLIQTHIFRMDIIEKLLVKGEVQNQLGVNT